MPKRGKVVLDVLAAMPEKKRVRLLGTAARVVLRRIGEEMPPDDVGPCIPGSDEQRLESVLHELGHYMSIDKGRGWPLLRQHLLKEERRRLSEVRDIGSRIADDLTPMAQEASELEALAIELIVADEIGWSMPRAAVVRSAARNNLEILTERSALKLVAHLQVMHEIQRYGRMVATEILHIVEKRMGM